MLNPKQNLFMAAGELAYAMAMADGELQESEKKKFEALVEESAKHYDRDFDISGIIFHLMRKDKTDAQTAYEATIKEIKLNSHYLSPKMKAVFVYLMDKVAEAYLPVTAEERELIQKFKAEINNIHGDPALYGND